MKKFFLLAILFLFSQLSIQAQQAKRYVLLEHFTNSVCSTCASKNPAFFNTISQYPEVHHIAYHPPVPYSSCLLYQHNPTENASRSNYYNIFGTPRVFLNGVATASGPLITNEALDNEAGKTSPLGIAVDEILGNDRDVTVTIKTFGTAPTGDLRLYVSILESTLNYNSPNGETVHHNVFRKFLANGTSFTPAADGEAVVQTFQYTLDSEWMADEIYVMAYVQNHDTKEIINSGNRFDAALPTSNKELTESTLALHFSPNPANDQLFVNWDNAKGTSTSLRLQDATGRQVWSEQTQAENAVLNLQNFPGGLYFLRLQQGKVEVTKKVIIQH